MKLRIGENIKPLRKAEDIRPFALTCGMVPHA